jgi:hypothetical protein
MTIYFEDYSFLACDAMQYGRLLQIQGRIVSIILFSFITFLHIIQCVHKAPSGFWKIVARKQIKLATFVAYHSETLEVFLCRQQMA